MISCYFIGPKPSIFLYFPPSKQGDEILIILEFELMSELFFSLIDFEQAQRICEEGLSIREREKEYCVRERELFPKAINIKA